MVRIHIDLPEELHRRVAECAEAAGYPDAGSYLRSLAEAEEYFVDGPPSTAFSSSEELAAKINEALAEPSSPMTDADWRDIHDAIDRQTRGTDRHAS